jgi:Animal haem peroxidase
VTDPRARRRRAKFVRRPELVPLREQPASQADTERLAELGGLAGAYKLVQLLVGILAIAFGPILVVAYWIVGGSGLGGSISSYYNSDVGDLFVGMLFALGFLFVTYHFHPIVWPAAGTDRGQEVNFRLDNWLADLAGACAVLVALCPTDKNPSNMTVEHGTATTLHGVWGGALFAVLTVFALWRFRMTGGRRTPEKDRRNKIYAVCGVLMLGSLVLYLAQRNIDNSLPASSGLVFETILLVAFGISWLLKSDYFTWLADAPDQCKPEPEGDKVQRGRPGRSTVRDGPIRRVTMWLAGTLDRGWGWDRLGMTGGLFTLLGLRMRLRRQNLFDTTGVSVGWGPERPALGRALVRSSNGVGTDPYHPEMGSAGTRFGHNVPLEFLDPTDPARVLTPNPKTVSDELLARREFIPATTLNLLFAAWIQFEVHDWMHHRIEKRDPWRVRTGADTMLISRSESDAASSYAGDEGPPTYRSNATHWWDASQIYGSTDQVESLIRTKHGGKLALTEKGALPFDPTNPCDPIVKQLRGGGSELVGASNGWWLGLALLHTLFMQEHNAICDHLAGSYPAWTDQQLYDTARLVNAALMAKIHTVEWTPALLANPVLERAMRINWWGFEGQAAERWLGRIAKSEELSGIPGTDLYYHSVPYAITEEFVAVYRMHQLIPDDFELRCSSDNRLIRAYRFGEISGRHTHGVLDTKEVADLFYSFGVSHPGQVVLHNYPEELRTFSDSDHGTVDLAAVDILRNRERGVPRYNQFRRCFGLSTAKRFDDFSDDPAIVDEIRRIYATPDDVDLLVGLYTERKPQGFAISDTAFRVFILMASRRLKSDRFFTYDYRPGVYTQEGLDWIDNNTLSSVILRHYPELWGTICLDNAFKPWIA